MTTSAEIETYLGLLLLVGEYRGRLKPVIYLWNAEQGRSMFRTAMTRNRFQMITRFMRFDSNDTRLKRRQLCVDKHEQLVVYCCRCPFKITIQKTFQFISCINGMSQTYKKAIIFFNSTPYHSTIVKRIKKQLIFFHLTPYGPT